MRKINKAILVIFLLLMISSLLFAVLMFSSRRVICVWDTDEKRLAALSVAIAMYEKDYGELPPEKGFKSILLERNIIDKEDVLYSGHGENILLRYYQDGDNYILVGPGENKRYDTPEGYDNIRVFYDKYKKKTDDIIKFSQ